MSTGAEELLDMGDSSLKNGDFETAVKQWRAAGAAGLEQAARSRLTALIRRYSRTGSIDRSVPKRALSSLKLLLVTTIFGTLAFFASSHGSAGSDTPLVWLGWSLYGVAFVSSLVFATRSGRLDGRTGTIRAIESLSLEDLAVHAEELARQLNGRRGTTMTAEATNHG
jgi:hypothetical protein